MEIKPKHLMPLKYLIVLTLLLIVLFATCAGNQEKIFICSSPNAKTYHNNKNCGGLNQCSYEINTATIEEAHKFGRRKCKRCYGNNYITPRHLPELPTK